MKAIQTRYAGCHFRSRLEARYAVLFDTLKIKWDYEPEGFELGASGRYLPDFWLHIPDKPGWGYWIEIKREEPSPAEIRKLAYVCRESKHHGWFFYGTPGTGFAVSVPKPVPTDLFWAAPIRVCASDPSPARVGAAIDAARSARFEFGESGAHA